MLKKKKSHKKKKRKETLLFPGTCSELILLGIDVLGIILIEAKTQEKTIPIEEGGRGQRGWGCERKMRERGGQKLVLETNFLHGHSIKKKMLYKVRSYIWEFRKNKV